MLSSGEDDSETTDNSSAHPEGDEMEGTVARGGPTGAASGAAAGAGGRGEAAGGNGGHRSSRRRSRREKRAEQWRVGLGDRASHNPMLGEGGREGWSACVFSCDGTEN